MNLFSDATVLSFLRDICVIMAFYLTIEHGLKLLRRNVRREQRVPQHVSQRISQHEVQREARTNVRPRRH